MAPSFDLAVTNLLCAEENCIFDDNDDDECLVAPYVLTSNGFQSWRHGGGHGGDGLPFTSDECLIEMVEKETHHLPVDGYLMKLQNGELDVGARKDAVDWIEQVSARFNFGPLCTYLAVNYMDRFLSAYTLPKGKAWTMQLLAVACLSLAAKLEETEVPISLDLQVGGSKFVFEARTIERMELLVLTTLGWRMQAVTPFSFIDHYLCKIHHDDKTSIARSIHLLLNIIQGIEFLEFKPSEIAAAVAISVAGEGEETAIPLLIQQKLHMERVVKCIKLVKEMSGKTEEEESRSMSEGPQSPSGVLNVRCLSYKSNESTAVGSCANSSSHHNSSNGSKRRRLNRPCEVEL
ncbi:cyclin-D4-2-like [Cucurbita maxima]|uniref:B-like cyclin n=1 Tax=Cucurbita maxima TaxID=3661 RepID=A0A6J1KJV9_CUCMA|nr:cyclin-D4-2-like [Cucurbita maxima]